MCIFVKEPVLASVMKNCIITAFTAYLRENIIAMCDNS